MTKTENAATEPPNSVDLDELSLTQALRDFEIANARVIDLTQRLIAAERAHLASVDEAEQLRIRAKNAEVELAELKASKAYVFAQQIGVLAGAAREITVARPRTLLAITVYNGEAFVPRALESAARIGTESSELDVLVLDDCSPAPGFSSALAPVCERLGIGYYRSPRNLGITRNVNLGLLRSLDGDYDFVIVSNSDVIYPASLLDELLATFDSDSKIGSITAWSNNVSAYSLPNEDPDRFLADQAVVDSTAASIPRSYHGMAVDIPAGISFCILIPRAALENVGLMDPIFGRGYGEEVDWSLRSLAAGYRIGLAPTAFVYHQGRGSTLEAGLVSGTHTSVPENEAVLDLRYPLFRSQVDAFLSSGFLDGLAHGATTSIIADTGAASGYDIDIAWLPRASSNDGVRVLVQPDGRGPLVRASFHGFECEIPPGTDAGASIREFFRGAEPNQVNVFERGPGAQALIDGTSAPVARHFPSYPGRV